MPQNENLILPETKPLVSGIEAVRELDRILGMGQQRLDAPKTNQYLADLYMKRAARKGVSMTARRVAFARAMSHLRNI